MKIVTDLKILEYEILQRFQTVKWGFWWDSAFSYSSPKMDPDYSCGVVLGL